MSTCLDAFASGAGDTERHALLFASLASFVHRCEQYRVIWRVDADLRQPDLIGAVIQLGRNDSFIVYRYR